MNVLPPRSAGAPPQIASAIRVASFRPWKRFPHNFLTAANGSSIPSTESPLSGFTSPNVSRIKEAHVSTKRKLAAVVAAVATIGLMLVGCSSNSTAQQSTQQKIAAQQDVRPPTYIPSNHVEYDNFNSAQKLYDSPNTIIWCTSSFPNANSPMFTTPIKGKLTSSSVSVQPNTQTRGTQQGDVYNPELPSNDGMYHGSPPAYRYGFTPGGQYVDYSGMEVFCTTALTSFQRTATQVTITPDAQAVAATDLAMKSLQAGDSAGAQRALAGIGAGK